MEKCVSVCVSRQSYIRNNPAVNLYQQNCWTINLVKINLTLINLIIICLYVCMVF